MPVLKRVLTFHTFSVETAGFVRFFKRSATSITVDIVSGRKRTGIWVFIGWQWEKGKAIKGTFLLIFSRRSVGVPGVRVGFPPAVKSLFQFTVGTSSVLYTICQFTKIHVSIILLITEMNVYWFRTANMCHVLCIKFWSVIYDLAWGKLVTE